VRINAGALVVSAFPLVLRFFQYFRNIAYNIFRVHSMFVRLYWLHQHERWARLLDQHAGWGSEARIAEALRHLDEALAEVLR
jgi:hypothetical protein